MLDALLSPYANEAESYEGYLGKQFPVPEIAGASMLREGNLPGSFERRTNAKATLGGS